MNNMNNSLKELQHAGKWLAALAALRRDAAHCDVLLKAESMTKDAASDAVGEANGVWAHRAVLAAASPYFYAMFYSSFEECMMQVVVLQGVKLDILQALVENIYTPAPLVVTVEKAKALLAAARKLDVEDVRDAACSCLARALVVENALGIHAAAELHACTALAIAAKKYIHDHFKHVLRADEFLALSPESLMALLKSDRIATIEEHVLDSVLRWTQNRPQVRRQHLASILRFVRLPLVPRSVLVERARKEPLASSPGALVQVMGAMESRDKLRDIQRAIQPRVQQPYNIQQHIQPRFMEHVQQQKVQLGDMQQRAIQPRVMEQHDMQPHNIQQHHIQTQDMKHIQHQNAMRDVQQRAVQSRVMAQHEIQSPVTEPHVMQSHCIQQREIQPSIMQQYQKQQVDIPCNMQSPMTLLVIGGGTSKNCSYSNTVLACSLPGGRWQSAGVLPGPRVLAGAALLNGCVYVVGGADGPHTMSTVFVYDATRNSWSSGPSMNIARWWLGVSVLAGRLYAVGGRDGSNTFNFVEALDPREGVWRPIANMITNRGGLGVAALKERLYAVGGHDGIMALNSTERYDPAADRWQTVESMAEQRMAVGVSVVGDAMYAVGGSSGTTLLSVEQYRAGLGWEPAPPMAEARREAAVATHDGRLYVAGGTDDPKLLSSVSMLDPATNLWIDLPALPTGRWGAAAVVVTRPPPPAP